MVPGASSLAPETQAALQKLMAQAQAVKAQAALAQPAGKPLPRLREDLIVSQGLASPQGEPTWLIYDPLRHRFIDINQATFKVLALWRTSTTVEGLTETVRAGLDVGFDGKEVERLAAFLDAQCLTFGGQNDDWHYLSTAASARPHGLLMSLVHNYLFFKIPLWSPQRFLEATKASTVACIFNMVVPSR